MYANADAIPATLRGGGNGHIGLLLCSVVYKNIANTIYTRPIDPGPCAQHRTGDTSVAQADAYSTHKEERRVYDLDKNVDAALKQEIIAAIEETHLSAKKQCYMGFKGVSAKSLVYHLMERYGKILTSDIETCRQALAEPIEVDRPINLYFQQVENSIQFVHYSKTPLTPAHIVQTAYHAVNKKCLYSLALNKWLKKGRQTRLGLSSSKRLRRNTMTR